MYLIVGLGNPGKEYENTRHNIGFDVIETLAAQEKIDILEKKHKGLVGKGYIDGEKVILAKPLTYMNLSGECVKEILDYYKIDAKTNLIVISDDISLAPGHIRIRKKGRWRKARRLRPSRLCTGTFYRHGAEGDGRGGSRGCGRHPCHHERRRRKRHEPLQWKEIRGMEK